MNLHLLPADNQLFVPSFVKAVADNGHAQNNLLMCYVQEMVVSAKKIPFAEPALVLSYINDKSVNRVIFHALQPQCFALIEGIKKVAPACRIDWVYWGETYDSLGWLMGNLTLIEYLHAHGLPNWLSFLLVKLKLAQSLMAFKAIQSRNRAAKYIRSIDYMFHWSHYDHEHVKSLLNAWQLLYKPFFYDAINDSIEESTVVENDLHCVPSESLILAHSATLRNNHLDVLSAVCEFAVQRGKILICPLSYGNGGKQYADIITKHLNRISGLSYRIIDKFYPQADYLTFLSKCGAYIAPGRGSIGAGNMLNYAISGGVPVTDHRNTTGIFLRNLGAKVAMFNNDKDIVEQLTKAFGRRSQTNRMIVSDTFSFKTKCKYYDELFAAL